LEHFLELAGKVIEFPRHLSIHNGGMLVTESRSSRSRRSSPATLEAAGFVQFNKGDDIEDLGLIKMDNARAAHPVVVARGPRADQGCDRIRSRTSTSCPLTDPKVFRDVQRCGHDRAFSDRGPRADETLHAPRPQTFNDWWSRSRSSGGSIQGNAVHPYIRRKQGRER